MEALKGKIQELLEARTRDKEALRTSMESSGGDGFEISEELEEYKQRCGNLEAERDELKEPIEKLQSLSKKRLDMVSEMGVKHKEELAASFA